MACCGYAVQILMTGFRKKGERQQGVRGSRAEPRCSYSKQDQYRRAQRERPAAQEAQRRAEKIVMTVQEEDQRQSNPSASDEAEPHHRGYASGGGAFEQTTLDSLSRQVLATLLALPVNDPRLSLAAVCDEAVLAASSAPSKTSGTRPCCFLGGTYYHRPWHCPKRSAWV